MVDIAENGIVDEIIASVSVINGHIGWIYPRNTVYKDAIDGFVHDGIVANLEVTRNIKGMLRGSLSDGDITSVVING